MNSKILLATLFFTIGFAFQNCGDGLNCDFGPVPDYFDVQGMSLSHWNTDRQQIDSLQIDFNEYGYLVTRFDVEYIAMQEPPASGFSLISVVYGCTPPEPGQLGSKEESFENISVVTLRDYDENHFAGDTINDLIELVDIYDGSLGDLDNFLLQDEKGVLNEFLLFSLKSSPTLNQEFQAEVTIELSTGEKYKELSEVVNFN